MSANVPPTNLDRGLAAMRSLVKSFFPQLVYCIAHEYIVAESDGLTFSGTPTDTFSPQLPTKIPYSCAIAGTSCKVPIGTLAYVAFANADPSKPYLVRFGALSSATAIGLAGGGPAVARVGDLAFRVWCVLGTGGIATLFISPSTAAPYVWTGVPVGISPPTPTDPGTPVTIAAGSSIVGSG